MPNEKNANKPDTINEAIHKKYCLHNDSVIVFTLHFYHYFAD